MGKTLSWTKNFKLYRLGCETSTARGLAFSLLWRSHTQSLTRLISLSGSSSIPSLNLASCRLCASIFASPSQASKSLFGWCVSMVLSLNLLSVSLATLTWWCCRYSGGCSICLDLRSLASRLWSLPGWTWRGFHCSTHSQLWTFSRSPQIVSRSHMTLGNCWIWWCPRCHFAECAMITQSHFYS